MDNEFRLKLDLKKKSKFDWMRGIFILFGAKRPKPKGKLGWVVSPIQLIFKNENADQHLGLLSNGSKSRKWVKIEKNKFKESR